MKTNLKQKVLYVVMGGIGALMAMSAPSAFAFPTSGTCAMLITSPVPYGVSLPHSEGYNILATLTFTSATTGTVNYVSARANYSTTGVSAGTPEIGSFPFTVAAGPIPDSKTITLNPADPTTAHMYAVNGDRTILVQGSNDLFSGVCQF